MNEINEIDQINQTNQMNQPPSRLVGLPVQPTRQTK
jgi:hypothetical protein